ncbi:hypothetical protein DPMN_110422 [Dreissena polymorpha]|uniref:Uncharacterized protein n=1 Tax=Dreissena polymorpha TaxID=45954 RepID=A0A9D4QN35_DREPO|nr:hypothetical protein DPMN_110422 [Dreissena polymorpha]
MAQQYNNSHIKKTAQSLGRSNDLRNFHEDTELASRVLTRKTSPSHGYHLFQWTITLFKHAINVTCRVFTTFYYCRIWTIAQFLAAMFIIRKEPFSNLFDIIETMF